jgi:hypothetical protein
VNRASLANPVSRARAVENLVNLANPVSRENPVNQAQ